MKQRHGQIWQDLGSAFKYKKIFNRNSHQIDHKKGCLRFPMQNWIPFLKLSQDFSTYRPLESYHFCCAHCTIFMSIPRIYSLDASSIPCLPNCDNQKSLHILPDILWRANPSLPHRLRTTALKELTKITAFHLFSFKIPQNGQTIWDITEHWLTQLICLDMV